MASFETKIESSGLYGAREMAREKTSSISSVKLSSSSQNRIEIRIATDKQSEGVIRSGVAKHHGNRSVSAK